MRILLFLVFLLLRAGWAEATVPNQSALKKAYPAAKAVSCKICHTAAIGKGGDLNPYGLDLEKLPAPKDYLSIDAADSDGDGAPNGEEIKAGTNPGDKASAPQKTSWDFQWFESAAWAEEIEAKADYVGSETCAACHTKEAKEFEHSTHARLQIPEGGPKAQGCEACHGPGSLHAEAGGGRGVGGMINPSKDSSACFACHLEKKAEFKMAFHHPVLEGKMSCADCHNPHGEDVRPWSATSIQDVNEACFKCHKDQRGPFVWEHEALREGCTTCHKVHGSVNDKMLVARDSNLCLRCHTQMNFPTIGNSAHGSRLPQGTCFSGGCHTAVHGSNFDEHLRY